MYAPKVSARGGFKISIAVIYARIHQEGARIRAHRRKAGKVLKNRRGRFISRAQANRLGESAFNRYAKQMERFEDGLRKTRPKLPGDTSFEVDRAEHDHRGGTIPRRQMLPDKETGGLGPIWTKALNETASALIMKKLKPR